MNYITALITKRYRLIVLIFILLTVPMLYFTLQQKFVNHIDIFFEKDDSGLKTYREFQDTFGNEEIVLIAIHDKNIFTKKNIETIKKLTAAAEGYEGVQRVFSITNTEKTISQNNTITFQKIIPEGNLSNDTLLKSKNTALHYKPIINYILSKDASTTAIVLELDSFEDNNKKKDLLEKVRNESLKITGGSIDLYFAGLPYVEAELNYLSERDFTIHLPVIIVVIFIIVSLMLDSLFIALLCIINLLLCIIWGIGFMSITGEHFDMVTGVIPPILLAISVAVIIHILSHYKEHVSDDGKNHIEALQNSITSLWLPCLMTSLTTGLGFFSFLSSSIRPVKILGIYTAVSIIFSFFISLFFLPSLMFLFRKYFENKKSKGSFFVLKKEKIKQFTSKLFSKLIHGTGYISTTYSKSITIASIILIALSINGISQITTKTNIIHFLPDYNKVRTDNLFIIDKLGGNIQFVVVLKAKEDANNFDTVESLQLVNDIQKNCLEKIHDFSYVFTVVDYYKELNRAFHNDNPRYYSLASTKDENQELYELGDYEILSRVITSDKKEVRLAANLVWDSNERTEEIENQVKDYLDARLNNSYSYTITGISSLYLRMMNNIQKTQITSFAIAFVLILFMMYFVCKDINLTLLSIVPNIFPILMIFGIMGWLAIPLNVSTIMIASITMGIAVDDTIHFVTWFKRNRASSLEIKKSLLKTYKDTGRPIVITTIVLFVGFFIFVFGEISPTKSFGLLTSLAMIFALIGDLIVFPALLMVVKPLSKK